MGVPGANGTRGSRHMVQMWLEDKYKNHMTILRRTTCPKNFSCSRFNSHHKWGEGGLGDYMVIFKEDK
jgi:hypothetical protein